MLTDGLGVPAAWGFGLVALDLSDPAGRDVAARWLAVHHGLTVGATAPEWKELPDGFGAWEGGRWTGGYVWYLTVPDGDCWGWPANGATDPAETLRAACLAAVGRGA